MHRKTFLELLIVVAIALGAGAAGPLLHVRSRGDELAWALSVLILAGLPLMVGLVWKRPTHTTTSIALVLLLACPIAMIATNALPHHIVKLSDYAYVPINDLLWEGYLLVTAGILTFVSAAWLVTRLRNRQWIGGRRRTFGDRPRDTHTLRNNVDPLVLRIIAPALVGNSHALHHG